jgi:hypothetical protein
MKRAASRARERGNVFVFILLGVVLFTALAFTMSRGFRGETTTRMSDREITLAAADILSYTQRLEQAVSVVRGKNVSEKDISFENPAVSGYAHSPAVPDANKVFNAEGGKARWQMPPEGSNDGSPWIFTGKSCIVGLGTDVGGCSTASGPTSDEDLVVVLPNVDAKLCEEINKRLNIPGGIPAAGGTGLSTAQFTGTFDNGAELVLTPARAAACFSRSGHNYFYSVLLQRP